MSTMDRNGNDEIVSFKATSIEPDEGNVTDEGRLQHRLAMSMMDEIVAKNWFLQKNLHLIGSVYVW